MRERVPQRENSCRALPWESGILHGLCLPDSEGFSLDAGFR